MSRKGGREFTNIECIMDASIQSIEDYKNMRKESP